MDLIDREKLMELLESEINDCESIMVRPSFWTALSFINDLPTVEAIPVQVLTDAILDKTKVVRCKDCKHSDLPAVLTRKYGKIGTLTCHNRYSPCNNRNVNEKDFCSYGKMRTSAE